MMFDQFQRYNASLELRMNGAKYTLQQWEGLRLPSGLTPDSVRALPEWQSAKRVLDLAFAESRKFNGQWAKVFARQTKTEIAAKRMAVLAREVQS